MPQTQFVNKLRRIDGAYYQPRAYWDVFKFEPGRYQAFGTGEVFYNRSKNPIRITHLTFCQGLPFPEEVEAETLEPAPPPTQPPKSDERLINNYALRVIGNDMGYQSEVPLAIPLWQNMQNQGSSAVNLGTVSWQFDKVLRQSAGDTFNFDIQPIFPIANEGAIFSVGLSGIGRVTGAPYRVGSRTFPGEVSQSNITSLSRLDTRNDGSEPIWHKQFAAHITGELQGSPLGDARNILIRAHQDGGSSSEDWFKGPQRGLSSCFDKIPLALLGLQTGRCLVHRLPINGRAAGDTTADGGWLLLPGQGLEVEVTNLYPERTTTERVWVAMVGHSIHS